MIYSKKDALEPATWTFVCETTSPTGTKNVVLRGEDGKHIDLPSSIFQAEYVWQGIRSSASTDAVKETLNNIRQNSTVRFAMLPFFLTGAAVLANAEATENGTWTANAFLPWVGLGLAIVGLVLETVISRNLLVWWEALKQAPSTWNPIWAHRNGFAVTLARATLFLPYPAMVGFWTMKATMPLSAHNTWAPLAVAALISVVLCIFTLLVWANAKPAVR